MPRIHYPKDIGTSRGSRGRYRPALPHPTAGSPFITKAHETLTRRPGESVVSVHRLRHLGLTTHPKSPQRRIPSLEGFPVSYPIRVRQWCGIPEGGPAGRDLLKEAFQRGTLAGSFPSRLGTRQSCRGTRFEYPSGPSPCHSTVQVYLSRPGSQPEPYARRDHGDSSASGPLPDYEPGLV